MTQESVNQGVTCISALVLFLSSQRAQSRLVKLRNMNFPVLQICPTLCGENDISPRCHNANVMFPPSEKFTFLILKIG
jgi:hypothetical protein